MEDQVIQTPPLPKNNTLIFLVIFVILLCGVVGYLSYQNIQLQSQIASLKITPTPYITPEPIVTIDPIVNWKTYTNENYRFSFSFPNNWINSTQQSTVDYGNREFTLTTVNGEFVTGVVFDIYDQTFKEQSWTKQFKLDGNKSVLISYVTEIGPSGRGGEKDLTIFDQILSTFKFTPQNLEIPSSINKIFLRINQAFDIQLASTNEYQFYSLSGFIPKNSWKLDLSNILTDKSKIILLEKTLREILHEDINSSADGVGQGVQGYENDQVYCFFLRGFTNADYVSCAEK